MLRPHQPDASGRYLAHATTESARLLELYGAAAASDQMAAAVPHCPGWTFLDLMTHVAQVEAWATHAVVHQAPGPAPQTAEPATLPAFAAARDALLAALDQDPQTPAWTFGPTKDVSFWQRRQTHEHLIHRIDAEATLGLPSSVDAELADDGIDEVVGFFHPRQVRLARTLAPTHAIELVTTDTGSRFVIGSDEPVAYVAGTAHDVLLLLWKRRPLDHASLRIRGDRAALAEVFAQPLTP